MDHEAGEDLEIETGAGLRSALRSHATLGALDSRALDRQLPRLYQELRAIARAARRQHQPQEGLGTTSIVHETYLKLRDQRDFEWIGRNQFLHLAALAMRSILVDNARHHRRSKRGGDRQRVPMEDHLLVSAHLREDVLTLDQALQRLAAERPRWADVVTCRIFGGLEWEAIAQALSVSLATAKRDWQAACLWLHDEIGEPLRL
ncbi:MAG: hypothetical protein KDI71_21315 [Xanthomonadales bacterium]|nr:hypothetical protein [Xanthomonadales bacterium]